MNIEYDFSSSKNLSFFEKYYPLIKIFEYGDEFILYDAKPHFMFIISNEELNVLIDFLTDRPEEEIFITHSTQLNCESVQKLLVKYKGLKDCGTFIKGPADEISPVDRDSIKQQLQYFDENIILRKFCLEVTEDCNYRCTYCRNTLSKEYRRHSKKYLTEDDACSGINYYFKKYIQVASRLPEDKKKLLLQIVPPGLSWYGGEPFLNFDLVIKSSEYFKNLPWEKYSIKKSDLRFSINTNLSIMDEKILHFLVDNNVLLYASLDGPGEEHDRCRVYENGEGTFSKAYSNLMKIKEFNEHYFKEKVSIFGVYTQKHDVDRCLDFNSRLGVLNCAHFPAEYTGIFVPDIEAETEKYNRLIKDNLSDFKNNILSKSENIDNEINYFSNIFKFSGINYDNPIGNNSLMTLITCPMGYDNLMVAANGNFLICHKTDGSMPIGNCRSGLNIEKMTDLYQRYNGAINNSECRNCWNVRFCEICAARRMTANSFINPSVKECDFLRLRTKFDFLSFIYLSINHEDMVEKIFNHRNDRTKYISYIDINDL